MKMAKNDTKDFIRMMLKVENGHIGMRWVKK